MKIWEDTGKAMVASLADQYVRDIWTFCPCLKCVVTRLSSAAADHQFVLRG